jgi:serine/threonine protein phosphatase PrpC
MTGITSAAATDVGRVRDKNEDTFLEAPDLGLYAVADGMGGMVEGKKASATACRHLRRAYAEARARGEAPTAALAASFRHANAAVRRVARGYSGTTLVALAFAGDGRVVVAHAGDSRAYRLRGSALERLTEDHTHAARLARDGAAPEVVARYRNVLTRAVGTHDEIAPTVDTRGARPGDAFLLCSDGVWDEVPEAWLCNALCAGRGDEPGRVVARVVRGAVEAGGRDNATALLVRVA